MVCDVVIFFCFFFGWRTKAFSKRGMVKRRYNTSWTQSWKYFSNWNDFDPTDLRRCNETRLTNAIEMAKYVEITGDDAGVDSSSGQMIPA